MRVSGGRKAIQIKVGWCVSRKRRQRLVWANGLSLRGILESEADALTEDFSAQPGNLDSDNQGKQST